MAERDEQGREALEDWLLDLRYPEAYDLSHALMASDWLQAHDAEVAAAALRGAADAIRKRGAAYRSQALTARHVGAQFSAEERMKDCEHIADWLTARADEGNPR